MSILERRLSRRDFIKLTLASSASVLFPEYAPHPEVLNRNAFFYRENRLLGIRNAGILTTTDPILKVHDDNQYLRERLRPTPAVTEGGATVYGPASTASDLLLQNAITYANSDLSRSLRAQNLITLANAVKSDSILSNTPRQSTDFALRFEELLNSFGIDGVMATKAPDDQGRIFEIYIRNHISEIWEGPLTALVIDIASLQTYQYWRDQTFYHENFQNINPDQTIIPAQFPWVAEISDELVRKSNLPDNKIGLNIRLNEIVSDVSGINFSFPEYHRPNHISLPYQTLSSRLQHLLQDPLFTQKLLDFRPDITDFYIYQALVDLGNLPSNTELELCDITDSVFNSPGNFRAGIPLEKLSINRLLTILSDAAQLKRSVLSYGHLNFPEITSGIFFVENYQGNYGSQSNTGEIGGMVTVSSGEPIFIYHTAGNLLVSSQTEMINHLRDNSSQIKKDRRIIIVHP